MYCSSVNSKNFYNGVLLDLYGRTCDFSFVVSPHALSCHFSHCYLEVNIFFYLTVYLCEKKKCGIFLAYVRVCGYK